MAQDYYCQIHGTFFDGSAWSTGLHVTSNQNQGALLTTWLNGVQNMWDNATYGLNQYYPVLTSVEEVTVATLNATMHETAKVLAPAVIPGLSTADTLPLLNSTLISLRTNGVGRTQRGRMYLPAMAETFVNNDVLIPAAVTNVKAAVASLFGAITADGSSVFIFNRKDTKNPPVIPAYTKSTISLPLVSNKPARQSRRTRRKPAVYA